MPQFEKLVFFEGDDPKKDPATGMPYLSVYGTCEVARIWGNGKGASRLFARRFAASEDLLYCLKQIINDLPIKRDWLNPDLERMARAAISRAENGDTDAAA